MTASDDRERISRAYRVGGGCCLCRGARGGLLLAEPATRALLVGARWLSCWFCRHSRCCRGGSRLRGGGGSYNRCRRGGSGSCGLGRGLCRSHAAPFLYGYLVILRSNHGVPEPVVVYTLPCATGADDATCGGKECQSGESRFHAVLRCRISCGLKSALLSSRNNQALAGAHAHGVLRAHAVGFQNFGVGHAVLLGNTGDSLPLGYNV